MPQRIRLGLLTPSSNTVMEPRVGDLIRDLPGVTAHFGRFRVTQISMGSDALGQFDFEPQLQAAELLADARCDVIAWGGTSGGWLGVENDRRLCAAVTERTGASATTSTLATLDAFRALRARTYALATPYLTEVQRAIQENFANAGYRCISERHLEDRGNFSFGEYSEEVVASLIREVSSARPGAVAVFCTNFDGTRVAPALERETGVAVLDSISATIWHALRIAGRDTAPLSHWGGIFALDLPQDAPASQTAAPA